MSVDHRVDRGHTPHFGADSHTGVDHRVDRGGHVPPLLEKKILHDLAADTV